MADVETAAVPAMERIMPCCRRFFHTWSHVFTRETTPAQYRDPFTAIWRSW